MRIAVTGARGMIGTATVKYCRAQGADVMAADSVGRPGEGEFTRFLNADLTDLGQVYDVLDGADAVIHLAAIAAQRVFPSAKTFFTNVGMTWNVLEAAARLKIKRVVMASSIQVINTIVPRSPLRFQYLPLDEDHPAVPHEDYGMSKKVGEVLADSFAEHWGLSAISFRFPFVSSPEWFARLPFADPEPAHVAAGAYLHLDDAARACYLAATADLPPNSHHVLYVAARDSCVALPSAEWARKYHPEAELRPGVDGHASLVSGARAEKLIGFTPQIAIQR
jgi:nucleoside-diphosphate-sugar epimerase